MSGRGKGGLHIAGAKGAIVPSTTNKGYHMYEAATLVATADHYLVRMRAPEGFRYEDAVEAAQLIFAEENAGGLAPDESSRALIALAEATGYSLTDLGA